MYTATCPICGGALPGNGDKNHPAFPFCSDRCRLIDLGRWLGEGYRIPTEGESADEANFSEDDDIP